MGALQAAEMARWSDRPTALRWHLQSNHYPPVSLAFLPVVERAIDLAESGHFDTTLALPNGRELTVRAIVDELHLWEFVREDGA